MHYVRVAETGVRPSRRAVAAVAGVTFVAVAGHLVAHRGSAMGRLRTNLARSSTPGPGFYDRLGSMVLGGLYRRVAADIGAGLAAGDALEIGCGPGHLAVELARARPSVRLTASDVDPGMVALARRRAAGSDVAGRVLVDVADVIALPYGNERFDLVFSLVSMHHWPDREAGLAEIHRVLRPGGRALIFDIGDTLRRYEDRRPAAAAAAAASPFGAGVVEPFPWPWRLPLLIRLDLRKEPGPAAAPAATEDAVAPPAPGAADEPPGEPGDEGSVGRPARRRATPRVRAYIGLGANVGDAPGTLAAAVAALRAMPGVHLAGVSRLYLTRPVGVTDQPDFHNAAVALDVPAGPDPATGAGALLPALKQIERAFGRQDRERWGPRELDLDLLMFGKARLSAEGPEGAGSSHPDEAPRPLQVPHPAARDRLFVLAPLADLAPRLTPPGWGETVARARARREGAEGHDAVRAVGHWDATARRWTADDPA